MESSLSSFVYYHIWKANGLQPHYKLIALVSRALDLQVSRALDLPVSIALDLPLRRAHVIPVSRALDLPLRRAHVIPLRRAHVLLNYPIDPGVGSDQYGDYPHRSIWHDIEMMWI